MKLERDAHRRLVASIRVHDLIEPLVVAAIPDTRDYLVMAGKRRLAALREVHRGSDKDPKVPCIIREGDAGDALALAENFAREPMHPLDEAEAFAKLASSDGKDAEAIACEFGVTERYVRQRMKLATLASVIKTAYREGRIDTATAEAFAIVPTGRQEEVWQEVGGNPQHAHHVHNIIANGWIDARHALFDITGLPDAAVSRDLFGERVLIERAAFMEAQNRTLEVQRNVLVEEGWSEVVIGQREELADRLLSMDVPEREFDRRTSRKLVRIAARREALEAKLDDAGDVDSAIHRRYEALETAEQEVIDAAPEHYSEATKAIATTFLILDPDGRVHRQCRVPRRKHRHAASGGINGEGMSAEEQPRPPTSDDLSDRQRADTFTHQTLAVREVLLKHAPARKRLLALILHEKVRSEALAVHHDANGVTLHAESEPAFPSVVMDRLRKRRAELDPFGDDHIVEDEAAYQRLAKLKGPKLDALIDLLTVECLTAHMLRRTELIHVLAGELKVDVRASWRPDERWLAGFRKCQLSHLMAELRGPVYSPAHETRKKSELVAALAKLFSDAAEGTLEDKALAERANRWLPRNLREEPAS